MPVEVDDGDEIRQPSAKRRKIPLACTACRIRKARCNGAKPKCGNCVQRLEQCVYRVSQTQLTEANEYVEALVGKIAELEGVVQQLRSAPLTSSASTDPEQNMSRDSSTAQNNVLSNEQSGSHPMDMRQGLNSQVSQFPEPAYTHQSLVNTSSPVDGMGGTSTIGIPSQAPERFYGSSSAASFMQQLCSMVSSESSSNPEPGNHALSYNKSVPSTQQRSGVVQPLSFGGFGDFSLLPRPLTDHLMSLYWSKVHHIYPFIHEPTFRLAYEQLWQPVAAHVSLQRPALGLGGSIKTGPGSPLFHCALNTMMALGLQFSNFALSEKVALTETLVHRSKSYFGLEMFDDGSVEVVQILLLLTQVFQFTTAPTRCWSTIGGACRLSQGLGLHIANPNPANADQQIEVELGNRIWHSCLMLDTIVSMTMGRPQCLPYNADFPLPSAVLPHEQAGPQNSSREEISELSFFVEAVKLYKTLAAILSRVYEQSVQKNADPTSDYGSFDRLVELHNDLVRFAAQVPRDLTWSSNQKEYATPMLAQQSNILHARYLHLHVLLYRPVFTTFCKSYSCFQQKSNQAQGSTMDALELPPETSFAHIASVTCVKRAIDLIVLIHEQTGTESTGAWWYNMFYTRTAAMVVLMATVCPKVCDSIGESTLRSSWECCKMVLHDKLPQHAIVQKCYETLVHLDEHIRRAISTQGPSEEPYLGRTFPSVDFDTDFDQTEDFWSGLFDASTFTFALDDFGSTLI